MMCLHYISHLTCTPNIHGRGGEKKNSRTIKIEITSQVAAHVPAVEINPVEHTILLAVIRLTRWQRLAARQEKPETERCVVGAR